VACSTAPAPRGRQALPCPAFVPYGQVQRGVGHMAIRICNRRQIGINLRLVASGKRAAAFGVTLDAAQPRARLARKVLDIANSLLRRIGDLLHGGALLRRCVLARLPGGWLALLRGASLGDSLGGGSAFLLESLQPGVKRH